MIVDGSGQKHSTSVSVFVWVLGLGTGSVSMRKCGECPQAVIGRL